MGVSPRTSATDIFVTLESNSLNILLYVLLKCDTRTKAIPVSLGSACTSSRNASRPPAEAPMPTTGTGECPGTVEGNFLSVGVLVARRAGLLEGVFFAMLLKY